MIWIIFGVTMIASLIASWSLKSKFKKYAQITLSSNMTGQEIAERMLKDHQIYDVSVTCVGGQLTDHYNPADKTVNLSEEVYYGRSAAAAAVAAHECGHAVQHATAYSMLEFRSALVPLQAVSGTVLNVIFMVSIFGSVFLTSMFPFQTMLLVIIAAYAVMTTFSFITLPVEYDASKRALAWIQSNGIVNSSEYGMAKDALNTAALTYVIAALGSLATLLYYVSMFLGSDR